MPRDVNAAAQMCCSMLSNPNTQPLIIVVDALNQVIHIYYTPYMLVIIFYSFMQISQVDFHGS